jgi:hypothetical protein
MCECVAEAPAQSNSWLVGECVCVNCEAHLWGLVEAGTPSVLPLPVPIFRPIYQESSTLGKQFKFAFRKKV